MDEKAQKLALEAITLLETNIDHLTGEELGQALDALNDLPEVLDATWFSGIGKKNRPAGLLRVICRPENETSALEAMFRHTHSLGIRRQKMDRFVLPRKNVMPQGKNLPAKAYLLEGVEYLRPEADAVSALAWARRRSGSGDMRRSNMKNGARAPFFIRKFLLVSLFAAFFLQRNRHSFAKTAAGLVNFVRWRP